MAISLKIDGAQVTLKKGSSIEYVWINWAVAWHSTCKHCFTLALLQFSENSIFSDGNFFDLYRCFLKDKKR